MKYKNLLILLVLLSLQISLIFFGEEFLGKMISPFVLWFVSLGLGLYAFAYRGQSFSPSNSNKQISPWWFFLLSILSVISCFEEVRKAIAIYPVFEGSDVMIQLSAQYERFVSGDFPYKPVEELYWKPFPVYMPMHWLPIGLSKMLHLDIRWSSFIIYAIASGIYGFFVGKHMRSLLHKISFSALPALVLIAFIILGRQDLFVTIEILIAAYYLLLATGLVFKVNWLIIVGIILCLLSRYTFIFWLPLFAILFVANNSFKKSFTLGFVVLSSLLLFYVIPFLRIDPTIFSKGILYHNKCAVGEWSDIFYTSTYGVNFAYLIKTINGDNNEFGVYVNRIIQAAVLLITMFVGLLHYFKQKSKPDYDHFLMFYLYVFVLNFFCFCPLTYRYYLIVLLALSIPLVALPFIRSTNSLKETN